jgi:hypothetical protein
VVVPLTGPRVVAAATGKRQEVHVGLHRGKTIVESTDVRVVLNTWVRVLGQVVPVLLVMV